MHNSQFLRECFFGHFTTKASFFVFLQIVFTFWANDFRTNGKKVSAGLSKLHSTCSEDYFQRKTRFWKKNTVSQNFRPVSVRFFCEIRPIVFAVSSEKQFEGLPKLHYKCLKEEFKEKLYFEKSYISSIIFGSWAESIRLHGKKQGGAAKM